MHDISIYDAIVPHVSKRKLKSKTERDLIQSLHIVLSRIGNKKDMETFLFSLLSKTEQLMLAKRLAIVVLIKSGIPESTIASTLYVTRETVARMRYLLELRGNGYEVALRKLENEKMFQLFKKSLISLARYAIRAAGGYVKPQVFD